MKYDSNSRDLGDFQTPPDLVEQVLQVLGPVGRIWPRVLEPTCGTGNFIAGLLNLVAPPREIRAFELQEAHVQVANRVGRHSSQALIEIRNANIFDFDFGRDLSWTKSGPLLVLGNPPWVTSAELGTLRSRNIPKKSNFRGLRGMDAMTGGSNFDLAEHILLKIATELAYELPSIAMLCKTTVARNVLRFAWENSLPVEEAYMRRIDARKWFGAAVDACLFYVKMGRSAATEARIYPNLISAEPELTISFERKPKLANGELCRTAEKVQNKPLAWRQGIKHDAASIMELVTVSETRKNALGEEVDVEADYVYPLLKGSDLFRQDDPVPRRSLIVTQRSLSDDTAKLRDVAPKLWRYLTSHAAVFRARKSRVFRRGMDFSMFGVGDYSFADYKVAVAGFYKTPRFRVVRSLGGMPVMLDDTCYFVPCESPEQAGLLACLLNLPACTTWMDSVVFLDSKRPITKSVLSRIDVMALLDSIDRDELASLYGMELARVRGPIVESPPRHGGESWAEQIQRMLSVYAHGGRG